MSEMELKLQKWACTKAPEQYKKTVEQAVNAQLVTKQEKEQGKLRIAKYSVARKTRRAVIIAAACLLFACSTVTLANPGIWQDFLSRLGNNAKDAETLIQSDIAEDVSGDLYEVVDVYLDGRRLVFTAKKVDGNEIATSLNCSDHASVNGVDCMMYEFKYAGDRMYEGEIYLAQELAGQDLNGAALEVSFSFNVSGSGDAVEKRWCSFTIPADTTQNLMVKTELFQSEKVEIKQGDAQGNVQSIGTVWGEFIKAPSGVDMTLHYEFTGEDAKEHAFPYIGGFGEYDMLWGYKLIDSQGAEIEVGLNPQNEVEEQNRYCIDLYQNISNLDYTSDSVTIIPVNCDYYKSGEYDGKPIESTVQEHPELAITIPMK